jgi:hypothetical protein
LPIIAVVAQGDSAKQTVPGVQTTPPAAIDVLATAHRLAETTYQGFTYGSSQARRQIDCTQFVQKVIEEVVGRTLAERESKAVLIAGLPSSARILDSLVYHEDPRTCGVLFALTDVLPIGMQVSPDSAQPGDLIQYWIKSKSGHYKGHSAILESISREGDVPTVKLFGSHKTLGRLGIATDSHGNQLQIRLKGGDRKVYLVRIVRRQQVSE